MKSSADKLDSWIFPRPSLFIAGFFHKCNKLTQSEVAIITISCSAGVGRTGTFIALDYLIQQVLITDLVDIPRTVRHLRRLRLSMVQSEVIPHIFIQLHPSNFYLNVLIFFRHNMFSCTPALLIMSRQDWVLSQAKEKT